MSSTRALFFTALTACLALPRLSAADEPAWSPRKPASNAATRRALYNEHFELPEATRSVHPRLFIDASEWRALCARMQAEPAAFESLLPTPSDGIVKQAPVAFDHAETGLESGPALAWLAVSWMGAKQPIAYEALERWRPLLEHFRPVVIPTRGNKANTDLVAGHLLLTFALAYDVLAAGDDVALKRAFRHALLLQARQTYDDLQGYPTYPYEQNHLSIPVCGLAVAAMALDGDSPDAQPIGAFAQAMARRCLDSVANDGWFFEGISYWGFTMQFPTAYAEAVRHAFGTDLFSQPPFRDAGTYLAHMLLPNPKFAFDFCDWGPRVQPDGIHFQEGYDWPWHTYPTSLRMFVPALIMHARPTPSLELVLSKLHEGKAALRPFDRAFYLLWGGRAHEGGSSAQSIAPYHYFPDMEVLHWRAGWVDPEATALAFKSGPPAGHHLATLLPRYTEWKPNLGHAHPDAGSFILFSRGSFLAGDTGYVGKKRTADTNSLLIDGQGQGVGDRWNVFEGIPYDRMYQVHLENEWLASRVAAATAVFTSAYDASLGLRKVSRELALIDGRFLVCSDVVEATTPREVTWLLHTDKPMSSDGRPLTYSVANGKARLTAVALPEDPGSVRGAVTPAVVETEFYDPHRSRPQQRGYRLDYVLPRSTATHLTVAMGIQGAGDSSSDFVARFRDSARRELELTDRQGRLVLWLPGARALEGHLGFALFDQGRRLTVLGLAGRRLAFQGVEVTGSGDAGIQLERADDGSWNYDCEDSSAWVRLRINGLDVPVKRIVGR